MWFFVALQFKSHFSPQDFDASTATNLELQDDLEDELAALMHQYSTNPPNDPLKQAQTDLNNVYVTAPPLSPDISSHTH